MKYSLIAVLFLVGCAGKWVKPGATEQEFYAAQSECMQMQDMADAAAAQRNIAQNLNGLGTLGGPTKRDAFKPCMMGKGFSRQ